MDVRQAVIIAKGWLTNMLGHEGISMSGWRK